VKRTKIFIICAVRSAEPLYIAKIASYVAVLKERGHEVYCPPFDTNQQASGYDICRQNQAAIIRADEVHIFYNSKSQGTHFDMGVAFALGKRVVIVENESYGEGKSFPRMLDEWSQNV